MIWTKPTLLNNVTENLAVDSGQLKRITDYIVAFSQKSPPPLQHNQLKKKTKKLADIRPEDIPEVQEHEIFQIVDKSKRWQPRRHGL